MARLTSYSNFIKGDDEPKYNQTKPYIYVLKYILSKENYIDELRDYILNYSDDNSDYEDDKSYDQFMKTLKIYAMGDKFDEIEDLVFNYDEFESDDFDETDDDFEEKMYYKDGFAKTQEIYFDFEPKSLAEIISEFDEDINYNVYDSRIEELEKMESELFDDEDDDIGNYDEIEELEDIDNEVRGIDIEFEEVDTTIDGSKKCCSDETSKECECEQPDESNIEEEIDNKDN